MAVVGRSLALNIESRGYTVSIFNRSVKRRKKLLPKIQARTGSLLYGERVC
ncbi:NAD(P)-binding domain-containing protein [Shigella flexneri]